MGKTRFTVALFGSRYGDWSSRQLALPPEISAQYLNRVGAVLQSLQAGRTFLPNMPSPFNARMVGLSGLMLERNKIPAGSYALHRDPDNPGEGVMLFPGEAVLFTPAGCGTAVLTYESRCVVFHFGRWSLFDRQLVETGVRDPARRHESIVHAALEYLGVRTEADAARVVVALYWSIHPDDFPHPVVDSPHAEINRSLHKYMRADLGLNPCIWEGGHYTLDLLKVVRLQLNKRGVPPKNINTDDGYLPKNGVWCDGAADKPRNAVLVIRRD